MRQKRETAMFIIIILTFLTYLILQGFGKNEPIYLGISVLGALHYLMYLNLMDR